MNNKTLAVISYITIIGWLIAYFSYKNQSDKNDLLSYHLEQALGLFIVLVILSAGLSLLAGMITAVSFLMPLAGILSLVLIVLGIINAANEALKPVPLVGKFFEKKFAFLS